MQEKSSFRNRALAAVLAILLVLNTGAVSALAGGTAEETITEAAVEEISTGAAVEEISTGAETPEEPDEAEPEDEGIAPGVTRETGSDQLGSSSLPAPERIDVTRDDSTAGDSAVVDATAEAYDGPVAAAGTLDQVWLDGESGTPGGDGSQADPVDTFKTARELVADGGTIYISGTVTVTSDQLWEDANIVRATDDVLVFVTDGAELTLSEIVMDGGGDETKHSLILVYGSTLRLQNGTKLQNNYNAGTSMGGAVMAWESDVFVSDPGTEITGNTVTYIPSADRVHIQLDHVVNISTAGGLGGGIYLYDGNLTVSDGAKIANNTAIGANVAADSVRGGGISAQGGRFEIDGAYIEGNSAVVESIAGDGEYVAYGGGIYADGIDDGDSELIIKGGAVIRDNEVLAPNTAGAFNSSAHGGGILAAPRLASMEITGENTVVSGNRATETGRTGDAGAGAGAGIHTDARQTTIRNASITDNETNGAGGGIAVGSERVATPTVLTVDGGARIDGNTAIRGGGIYIGAQVQADIGGEAVVSGNEATDGNGGGLWIGSDNEVMIYGTAAVSGNTATGGQGGGIYAYVEDTDSASTAVTVTGRAGVDGNTSVMADTYGGQGGGIYAHGADISITGTAAVSGNRVNQESGVQGRAGGIYIGAATLYVDGNAKITGNGSTSDTRPMTGGGIYAADSAVTLTGDAEITDNSAYTAGFGIYIAGGALTANGNVLIGENTGSGSAMVYAIGSTTSVRLSGDVLVRGSSRTGIHADNISELNLSGNAAVTGSLTDGIGLYGGTLNMSGNARVTGSGQYGVNARSSVTAVEVNLTGGSGDTPQVTDNTLAGLYFNSGGRLTVTDAVIARNGTETASYSYGGIYFYTGATASSLTIGGSSRLTGNYSSFSGGAISISGSAQTPVNVSGTTQIGDNRANVNGGAIAVSGSGKTVSISDQVRIYGNSAPGDGGAIYINENTTLSITGSGSANRVTLTGNTAGGDGGAIYTESLSAVRTNYVTFSDNRASRGYSWSLESPGDYSAEAAIHNSNILNTLYTGEFTNAYSNYDINFAVSDDIVPPEKEIETIRRTSGDEKTGNKASAGDTITYAITYHNYYTGDRDMTIEDLLPDELTFVEARAVHPQDSAAEVQISSTDREDTASGLELTYDPSEKIVELTVDDVAGGTSGVLYVTALVGETEEDQIVNTARTTIIGSELTLYAQESTELTAVEKWVAPESQAGHDGAYVATNNLITYRISYYNYKEDGATITIVDELDDNVTFEGAGDGSFRESENVVTWTLYDQPHGAEGSVWVTVRVNDDIKEVSEIVNRAKVWVLASRETTTSVDPDETNEVVNPVYPGPNKSLNVDVGSLDYIEVGTILPYTVVYFHYDSANKNPQTITISDRVPDGTVLDSVSSMSSAGSNVTIALTTDDGTVVAVGDAANYENVKNVVWTFEDVPYEESVQAMMEVRVVDPDVGVISNTATGKVGENGPELDSNSLDTPTAPAPVKELVEGAEEGYALEGDELTYTVAYENYMNDAAEICLTDVIPEGTTFVRADVDAGEDYLANPDEPYTAHDDGSGNVTWVEWQFVDVPREFTVVVRLTVRIDDDALDVLDGNLVVNTAHGQVGDGPNIESNPVETPVIPRPEKDIDAGGGEGYVQVGDQLTYRIGYYNYTDSTQSLTITDMIPEGTKYVDAQVDDEVSVAAGDVLVYRGDTLLDESGGDDLSTADRVVWAFSSVPAGGDVEVTLTVEVLDEALQYDEVTNTASANVGNQYEIESEPVVIPVESDLDKALVDGYEEDNGVEYAVVGSELTYAISYTNTSNTAQQVVITDYFPEHTTGVRAWGGDVQRGGVDYFEWVINSLDPGGTATVYMTVRVLESALPDDGGLGEVSNQAQAQIDNGPVIRSKPVDTPVYPQPEKTVVEEPDDLQVGDELTYEIEYYNYTDDAERVTISDRIPEGTAFVKAEVVEDSGVPYEITYEPDENNVERVIWTFAQVPSRGEVKVSLTVRVTEDAFTYDEITNTATGQVGDNHPGVESNPVPADVPGLIKELTDGYEEHDGEQYAVPGSELTYTVTYMNRSEDDEKVVITDEIPEGTIYVAASGDPTLFVGSSAPADPDPEDVTSVQWSFDRVESGVSVQVTLTVLVTEDALPDDGGLGQVTNVAGAEIVNKGTISSNPVETPVYPAPEKEIETTPDDLYVGQELIYTITYTNYTDGVENVIIRDRVPEGTAFADAKIVNDGGAASSGYTESGGLVTWTFENVPAKGEVVVCLTVRVTEDAFTYDKITNTATGQVGDNGPEIESDPVDVYIPGLSKELTEGAEAGYALVGDELTYTIAYKNTSGDTENVVITDEIPDGAQLVSASGSPVYYSGGTVVDPGPDVDEVQWSYTLEAGEEVAVTLTVLVTEDALPGDGDKGEVVNEAVALVNGERVESGPVETPVYPGPDKEIETTPDDLHVGQELSYLISYTNYTDGVENVIIRDRVPEGTAFADAEIVNDGGAASSGYTESGGLVTWTFENVPAKGEVVVCLTVRVTEDAFTYDKITNTATGQVGDNGPEIESDPVDVYIPGLSKELTEGAEAGYALVGDELTYTITYKNTSGDTENVVITDEIPDGAQFLSASGSPVYYSGGTVVDAGPDVDEVRWTYTLEDGDDVAVTLTVLVTEDALPGDGDMGEVVNEAIALVNGERVESGPVETPVYPGPNKEIEATPDDLYVGQELSYIITYTNYTGGVENVIIRDRVPEGTAYANAEILDDGGATGANQGVAGGLVTWTFENVPAKGEVKVRLTVRVTEDAFTYDKITNTATGQVGDNGPEIESDPVDVYIPGLSKELTEGAEAGYALVGDELTYTITYRNTSGGTENVVITDEIPDGTQLVSASGNPVYYSGGTVVDPGPDVDEVQWSYTLEAGDDVAVTLTVLVTEDALDPGEVVNEAVALVNGERVESGPVETPVYPRPDKEVADNQTTVLPGEEITYNISYRNHTGETQQVTIRDTVPTGTSFVAADVHPDSQVGESGCQITVGSQVVWSFASVAPGQTVKVTLTVRVSDEAVVYDEITNTASGQIGDNGPVIDSEPVTTPVAPQPEKELETTLEDGYARVGDELTYVIRYENGLDTAAEIVITDTIPAGTVYAGATGGDSIERLDASGNPTTVNANVATVRWTFSSVASKASVEVGLTVRVTEDALLDDPTVVNSALGRVGPNGPWMETNPVETPVIPAPEKALDNLPGSGYVEVGEELRYTVRYNNVYPGESITITDVIPEGTAYVSAAINEGSGSISYRVNGQAVTDPGSGTVQAVIWTFPNAPAGELEVDLTVRVTEDALAYDELTNTATARIGDNGPTVESNPVDTPVGTPDDSGPEKALTGGASSGYAQVGETLTYTISHQNYLSQRASIVITDEIPEGTVFAGAGFAEGAAYGSYTLYRGSTVLSDNPANYERVTRVVWNFANVPAGVSVAATLSVTLTEDAASYDVITNTATGQVGDRPAIETDPVETPVVQAPEKTLTAGANQDNEAEAGDELTYAISYRNYTRTTATVTITDEIPEGTEFVDASGTSGVSVALYNGSRLVTSSSNYDSVTRVVWTFSGVRAGATVRANLTVKVLDEAVGDTVVNVGQGQVGSGPTVETNPVETDIVGSVVPRDDDIVVRYHTNYGDIENEYDDVIHEDFIYPGDTTTPPDDPERNYYVFLGWYTEREGGELFDFETELHADTDLYAEWDIDLNVNRSDDHYAYLIGFEDGLLRPEDTLPRSQMATILFRLVSDEDRQTYWTKDNTFDDVEIEQWYNNYISTMEDAEIVEGYEDGLYRPDNNITRAEFAVAVVRFINADPDDYDGENHFDDVDPDQYDWAINSINIAAEVGWVLGDEYTGDYRPGDTISRAEVAAIVNRVFMRQPETIDDLQGMEQDWPDMQDTTQWYYLDMQEATSSHYWQWKDDQVHERWTALRPNLNWANLQNPDSELADLYR